MWPQANPGARISPLSPLGSGASSPPLVLLSCYVINPPTPPRGLLSLSWCRVHLSLSLHFLYLFPLHVTRRSLLSLSCPLLLLHRLPLPFPDHAKRRSFPLLFVLLLRLRHAQRRRFHPRLHLLRLLLSLLRCLELSLDPSAHFLLQGAQSRQGRTHNSSP